MNKEIFMKRVQADINSQIDLGMITKAKAKKLLTMAEQEADENLHMSVTEFCDMIDDLV